MDNTRLSIRRILRGTPLRPIRESLDRVGEWWIDDSGFAQYADGDIGDRNHEMIAFESALGISFDEAFYPSRTDLSDIEAAVDELTPEERAEFLANYSDAEGGSEQDHLISATENYDLESETDRLMQGGSGPESIMAAVLLDGDPDGVRWFRDHPASDARDWAMEKQNWIRVQGDNFQLWTYDDEARNRIADFLLDESVLEQDDLDKMAAAGVEINVEEMKPGGQYFTIELQKVLAPPATSTAAPADVIRQRLLPGDPSLYSAPGE